MTTVPLVLDLHVASSLAPTCVEIADGEALLIGRDPEPSRLPATLLPTALTLRTLRIDGRTISGNHLLAWRVDGRVFLCDLRSSNGTTLPLPAQVILSLPEPPDGVLPVNVAPSRHATSPATPRPRDAEWSSVDDFPHAVAREVESWLQRAHAHQNVRAERRGRARDGDYELAFTAEWSLVFQASGGDTVSPGWVTLLEEITEYAHLQAARLREELSAVHGDEFIMASPAFREAHRRVSEAAARGLQTVLLGETGSGKSTLARCYHLHSDRARAPFEGVNCAEIDRNFARTRLFGARKGAYTGCHADIAGAVECARGGTLFLDEIAELSLEVQGELLTFLDDQRYKRLGDDQWSQADVRVVCGTNGDLRAAVREKRFRSDLWYRIAGRIVEVPPLRARPEDIVATLRARTIAESRDVPSVYDALTPEARRHVTNDYPWPGNFRELEAFVRRLPAAAHSESIGLDVCLEALREGALDPSVAARAVGRSGGAWGDVTATADRVWALRNRAAGPTRAQEFREYVEEMMKPLFFARALELEHLTAVPDRPTPSFEEMGRRMGCDASTVKNQLMRYVEIRALLEGSAKP